MNSRYRLIAAIGGLGLGALALVTCSLLAQAPAKNENSIEFVKIAAGEFMMGCSESDDQCGDDEKPAHRVQLTKAFEMGKYEVTQAQWQSVMTSNPSAMKGESRPVETIAKTEAEEFLNRLNARNDGYHYRLPTEAEWEYAARAGTKGPYAGKLADIAWYADNSEDESHPVGMKKPNAWGLYDMEGNVREWVSDTYGRNYYSNSPVADPTGPPAGAGGRGGPRGGRGGPPPRGGPGDPPPPPPPGGFPGGGPPPPRGGVGPDGGPRGARGGPGGPGGPGGNLPVMRGGAWDNFDTFERVSSRYNYYGPTLRTSDIGFRAVREPVAR
ncbi:MAG TPA: formylglycine-generating enzyme family protein [Terriglobia bacterium]|nr:formylglycine-generating enzyme family protein [Terriglobia bacterium]